MTDVVVLGSVARERRWETSVKGRSLRAQLEAAAAGTRDKPLVAIRLADLVASLGIVGAVLARSTCSDFGEPPAGGGGSGSSSSAAAASSSSSGHGSRWLPRGPGRDRGALLPRLLVTDDGADGGAIAKGLALVCIPDAAAYWPDEDPRGLAETLAALQADADGDVGGGGVAAASSSAAAAAASSSSEPSET